MKRIVFIVLLTTALITIIIFTGCQSLAQKEKDAQAKVQEAKQDLIKAQNNLKIDDIKKAGREEWKQFRSDAEMKIKKTEMRMAELKLRMKKQDASFNAVFEKRMDELELKNKELKTRIGNYENKQNDWYSFKLEFNHDMDVLAEALKDITGNNKK